jgi:hypothetical protein
VQPFHWRLIRPIGGIDHPFYWHDKDEVANHAVHGVHAVSPYLFPASSIVYTPTSRDKKQDRKNCVNRVNCVNPTGDYASSLATDMPT